MTGGSFLFLGLRGAGIGLNKERSVVGAESEGRGKVTESVTFTALESNTTLESRSLLCSVAVGRPDRAVG